MTKHHLPLHRADAITAYLNLVEQYPELFVPREYRPLILDRDEIVAIAAERLQRRGEAAVVIGLAARTPWHIFLTDLIRLPDGTVTTYDRLVPTSLLTDSIGVAVVAMARDFQGEIGLVLVRQERHATGRDHWEIPRGFGEARLKPAELAIEELEGETGFTGVVVQRLATMHTNSGQTAERVHYILVEAQSLANNRPDPSEAILGARVWSRGELWEAIEAGDVTDAFTLNGLALLERYLFERNHGGAEGTEFSGPSVRTNLTTDNTDDADLRRC